MPVVFVVAEEWMLRAGIRAELRERGIKALGMENAEEIGRAIAAGEAPSAIVLDASAKAASDPAVQQLVRHTPTVVIASRVATSPPPHPAAKVLFRPVQIGEIVAAVSDLLNGLSV
ncbi:MAG TPA: hypothetical protein VKS20_10685 [Candidatus Acidoferrales bacterium]|nr:hypothetical protein [Candidatus Acidoferrales bacterium]